MLLMGVESTIMSKVHSNPLVEKDAHLTLHGFRMICIF